MSNGRRGRNDQATINSPNLRVEGQENDNDDVSQSLPQPPPAAAAVAAIVNQEMQQQQQEAASAVEEHQETQQQPQRNTTTKPRGGDGAHNSELESSRVAQTLHASLDQLGDVKRSVADEFCDSALSHLDSLVQGIDQCLSLLAAANSSSSNGASGGGSEESSEQIKQRASKIIEASKKSTKAISEGHKKLHVKVSKYGKTLQEAFDVNTSIFRHSKIFVAKEDINILNRLIYDHLCMESYVETSNILSGESKIGLNNDHSEVFVQMRQFCEEIVALSTENALAWINNSIKEIESNKCSIFEKKIEKYNNLKCNLLGLYFSKIVHDEPMNVSEKFNILRELSSIPKINNDDLKQLAGLMIADEEQILNKLEHPSSISIIKPPGIVAEIFGEVFLKHYDRISLKPLEACFKAGLLALPGIFDSLNNSDLPPEDYWNHQQNLSFDFNLPLQYTYHSRLVCPVLKTQSTSNNPPYALKCGHILSNDAINSMIGSSSNKDIKCPYCPVSSPKNSTLKLNIQ